MIATNTEHVCQGLLDTEKLEHILTANWTQFLNARSLRSFVQNIAAHQHGVKSNIAQLTISRFEFQANGFLIWLEANIHEQNNQIKLTIESILSNSGNLSYVSSTID